MYTDFMYLSRHKCAPDIHYKHNYNINVSEDKTVYCICHILFEMGPSAIYDKDNAKTLDEIKYCISSEVMRIILFLPFV